MKLFLVGNIVEHDGELWEIKKFYESDGHTLYAIVNCKTGLCKVVDETKIEGVEE